MLGLKVTVAIATDNTEYAKAETTNVGETFSIKVRGVSQEYTKALVPLKTSLKVIAAERASVWGEFHNQLTVIGKISVVKEA